jgi:nucleoside-diphosphate-sugar epimerase
VLGGSVFLSKAVAAEAVRRGHEVICANRGTSGSVPEGAHWVKWDRTQAPPPELTQASYDAVVDVARHPSWVRSAVAAFASAHWVFVSTINVYADDSTPGGKPANLPLREPIHEDVELSEDPEAYGAMKVACEQIVRDGARQAMIVRPGLIVGPGDPSGRFTYWSARMADSGDVLAPGRPADTAQVIDVRDLAHWIVGSAEQERVGDYDGVGELTSIGALLTAVAEGCEADVSLTWVPQDFLVEQRVEPWSGPDSVPLWLPRPEYDGLIAHDAAPSFDAGLTTRPIAETARDTLAWLRTTPDATVSGISRTREAELLAAWRAKPAQET